ncbi:MAG: N-acetylmuramoyl-L-alanine amidase [Rhizobiales bacterium]|nr:N-acetylmuramoyl-L-alanine amidase [Hyphomicrobiales bacterium]
MLARITAILCFILVFQNFAAASETPSATGARVGGDATRSRFVADLSAPVGYSVYVLANPYRVVIDMPEVNFQLPSGIGQQARGLIREYRFGRLEKGQSRFVLDVVGPVLIERSFLIPPQGEQPARLVVDIVPTDNTTFLRTHMAEQVASAKADLVKALPEAELVHSTLEDEASNKPPEALPFTEASLNAPPVPLPRPKPGNEKVAMEPAPEAVPLDKPERARRVIVIDPGHGGIDPGAIGIGKTKEKDVVLAFAKVFRDQLRATGRYDVVMTRDDDRFVTLKERVRIARRTQADLFIAIHADKVRGPTARGATIYTLSEKASDAEAEALAQKENLADVIGGVDLGGGSEEVNDILIDLTQRETKNHSVFFAKKAVRQLKSVTTLTGRPMRSAGFLVLKAPDIPSVLLELGYLSSDADEKLLNSDTWREGVGAALVAAIDGYMATEIAQRQ